MDIVETIKTMTDYQVLLTLFLAAFLGACIGTEREYKNRPAGVKTHALVSLGAALFVTLGYSVFGDFAGSEVSFDPSRVLAAVITGIGFIGGGLIIKRQFEVEGITTAAGLWIAAGVGATTGMNLYFLAIFVTLLTLFIFHGLGAFENKYIRKNK